MFDHYNKDGPLFIILIKKLNLRFQFHFESNQFRDEKDHETDLDKLLNQYPKLKNLFQPILDKWEEYDKAEGAAWDEYRIWDRKATDTAWDAWDKYTKAKEAAKIKLDNFIESYIQSKISKTAQYMHPLKVKEARGGWHRISMYSLESDDKRFTITEIDPTRRKNWFLLKDLETGLAYEEITMTSAKNKAKTIRGIANGIDNEEHKPFTPKNALLLKKQISNTIVGTVNLAGK